MDWQNKIKEYCYRYNIPLEYLSDTLYEPKVVPMIRGKAFEFSVMLSLSKVLPQKTWQVSKVPMNAQQGFHDIDVVVQRIGTNKKVHIECKLAAKGSFRIEDEMITIRVKCMRSRTLGESMVKLLAPKFGVSRKQLAVHNDQYRPEDFDIVITSIGNAFYETDKKGFFNWSPSEQGTVFLRGLQGKNNKGNLKDFAFNQSYLALADALSIVGRNGVRCTRKKCSTKIQCGFIPNYPIIKFKIGKTLPEPPWVPIENSESLFKNFLGS